ncbi:MAG: hypothetical protein KBD47_02385 [Candidatus Pacebacteria bacterium]|jgi:hypothetical protein|nr:hypothetical protein [Candidatus Paceibacterota bacterium]
MENINNNPTLKKSLEGVALLIALVGAFFLGQNVTKVEFADVTSLIEAAQTANTIDALRDPFAGYEYVLIDNSQGIRKEVKR